MYVLCGAHLGQVGTSGQGTELLVVPGAGAGTPLPSSGTGSQDSPAAGLPGRRGHSRDMPGSKEIPRPGITELW